MKKLSILAAVAAIASASAMPLAAQQANTDDAFVSTQSQVLQQGSFAGFPLGAVIVGGVVVAVVVSSLDSSDDT